MFLGFTHTLGLFLLLLSEIVQAQTTSFICSTQNTGADFSSVFNQFQSRGACSGTCSGYAFAVVQGSNCWCSNFFPGTEVATSECDTVCPGFGAEICGGTFNGAFAYYQLAQASGTQQVSSAAVSSTALTALSSATAAANPTTSASEAGPVTVVVTQTATPTPNSTGSPTTTPAAGPNSSTATRTSLVTTPSSRSTNTRTSSGTALQTGSTESLNQSDGFFDSPGKVAGTFVAVGLVILALLSALLWFFCRRRRQQRSDSVTAAGLNRKTSSTSTIENNSAFSDARSRSESASGLLGAREKPLGRVSPNALNWPIESSEIVPIDQRMNPKPMLMRFDSNYSRHSLRDDEDYSRRVLTVANPEP